MRSKVNLSVPMVPMFSDISVGFNFDLYHDDHTNSSSNYSYYNEDSRSNFYQADESCSNFDVYQDQDSSSNFDLYQDQGKGRFGKRPSSVYLEKERILCDNSNDSGFDCDWSSQSETTQFGWNNTYQNTGVHSFGATDFTALKFNNTVSSGKFGGLNNFKVAADPPKAQQDCSYYASSLEDSLLDSSSRSNFASLAPTNTIIPQKTMPSPTNSNSSSSRLSSDGSLASSPVLMNGSMATQSPVPVKRPRYGYTNSGSVKGAGLKLRNQNGVQVKNTIGKRLPPGTSPTLSSNLSPVSSDGRSYLQIVSQPEEQHRARYQTEGSRGAIKDRKCNGFPTVKLFGYDKPATLQIFIGTDQGKASPHMFYQACKVTGKSSTPCMEKKVEGTVMIEIEFDPTKDMTISCDCVGILKERNVDVEQRFPFHHASATQSRKKSTKCRMVFRTTILNANGIEETLQVSSLPILCTQPPGQPEICKQSMNECPASGGKELFIIGKNFLKDTKVLLQEESNHGEILWEVKITPHKDFLQQTHLICMIPGYRSENIANPVDCKISVWSGGKTSEPHRFVFLPNNAAAPMALASLNVPVAPIPENIPQQIQVQAQAQQQQILMSPQGTAQAVSPLRMSDNSPIVDIQGSPSSINADSPMVASGTLSGSHSTSSGMSSHMSPTGSISSPLLSNHNVVCASPPDAALDMGSSMQMQPMAYETGMIPAQSSSFTAVEELKTLLEQTQDEASQHPAVDAMMSDVKSEETVSPTVIEMKPSPTFAGLAQEMGLPMTFSGSSNNFNTVNNTFEVESPLLNLINNNSNQMNPIIAAAIGENSHHAILPIMANNNNNISDGASTINTVLPTLTPMTMTVTCEPLLKTENPQTASQEGQAQNGHAHPQGVFINGINGDFQAGIANALTQMSDNELINYINPSCFDQGAF